MPRWRKTMNLSISCFITALIIITAAIMLVRTRASNEDYPKAPEDFTITEKAPTRAFFWLKVPTSAFTFQTLCKGFNP